MNAKQIIKHTGLAASHSLYREDGLWYHHLKLFPGILFDADGYVIFSNQEEYLSNPYLQHAKDLHVKGGISKIPGYIPFTEDQRAKLWFEKSITSSPDIEEIIRRKREIEVILRNYTLVRKLKKLYNDICQLCETQLLIKTGQYYSEVHHIRPLGNPHNGSDVTENMLCVCPNCHVLLDLGAIKLNKNTLKSKRHKIDDNSVNYYNEAIYHSLSAV